MIKDIREFIHERIIEVDPELSAWDKDLFNNNNANEAMAERFYNLSIGETTIERTGNGVIDNFPLSVKIMASSTRNVLDTFDSLYDKALSIRNQILCYPKMYESMGMFIDFEPLNIVPSEEASNDNMIVMNINFLCKRGIQFYHS